MCAEMLTGYRDRVTDLICDELLKYHRSRPGSSNHNHTGAAAAGVQEKVAVVNMVPPVETYLHTYGIIHEHWHIEDWIQTRQTMRYSAPLPLPLPSHNKGKAIVRLL